MARSGKDVRKPGLAKRLKTSVQRKVVAWVGGPGVLYHTDERQRIVSGGPFPPWFRTFEVEPDEGEPIRVGRYSAIQSTAIFMHGGEHYNDWVSQFHGHLDHEGRWVRAEGTPFSRGPIVVGSDVWIGFEALITSGVTIGDGAVVGARTVLRRDVQPFEIVAGNPARHTGFRFEEPVREALLRIRWWDWSDEKVRLHADQIHSADVAGFIAGHDPELGAPSCPLCS
ncbi:CatB-related O-acetyltransferase [Marmoricola sp. RAF53]|uniref:CatB-related O-acetyltransferase n=1 Tax=Marmoricola sp. RAF53 TaxID=3233059 RepID=UPI003F94D1D0